MVSRRGRDEGEKLAVLFLFFPFLYLLPLLLLTVIPFVRVLLCAIESARDPNHRVAPRSPWFFFDRTFKRKMRRVWVVWALIFVCLFVFYGVFVFEGRLFDRLVNATFSCLWVFVGPFGLTLLLCLFLTPRFRRVVSILGLSVPAGVVLYFVTFGLLLIPPIRLAGDYDSVSREIVSLIALGHVSTAIALPVVYWCWVRRRNDRWFRFEQ